MRNLIIPLILMTAQMAPIHAQEDQVKQTPMHNIDFHIMKCRYAIRKLGHHNSKVMKEFKRFSKNLKSSYIQGEGMIDKDIHRILTATIFSATKHQFQIRKDPEGTPYIVHPIGVANLLLEVGSVRDPDIIIAALLHDTVEDTDTSLEEIEDYFGARVRDFVDEVSDDKSLSKKERKRLQIEHAPNKSAGAAQIKLADKMYNLRDLRDNPPLDWEQKRITEYFTWAKSVVNNLPWVNGVLKKAVDEVIEDSSE